MRGGRSTLAADTWSCEAIFGVVGVSAGAACSLWRGVWVSEAETNQQQHNKALHPTARSLRVFRLSGSPQSWSWLAGGG